MTELTPTAPPAHRAAMQEPTCNRGLLLERGWEDHFGQVASGGPAEAALAGRLARRRRMAALRSGVCVESLKIASGSTLVIGTGTPSAIDFGLLTDRPLGTPYVPASAVKGAVRDLAEGHTTLTPDDLRGGVDAPERRIQGDDRIRSDDRWHLERMGSRPSQEEADRRLVALYGEAESVRLEAIQVPAAPLPDQHELRSVLMDDRRPDPTYRWLEETFVAKSAAGRWAPTAAGQELLGRLR